MTPLKKIQENNICKLNKYLFFIILLIIGFRTQAKSEYSYANDFNSFSHGWIAEKGAFYCEDVGRSGSSLRLSTYDKDGDKGIWRSQRIKTKAKRLNVGAWSAQDLVYAQDPYYCAILLVDFYNQTGERIARQKLIDFVQEPKSSKFQGAKAVPEGLGWDFFSSEVKVPPKTMSYQLVFCWAQEFEAYRNAKNIRGSTWLDDLTVIEMDQSSNHAKSAELVESRQSEGPRLNLVLRSEMPINLFTPTDKFKFDILINTDQGKFPVLSDDVFLNYSIYDFQRLLVQEGKKPFTHAKIYEWNEDGGRQGKGLLSNLDLSGELTSNHFGKWLELKVMLTGKKGRVLATGNISFAIVEPDRIVGDAMKFRFLRGTAESAGREWSTVYNQNRVPSDQLKDLTWAERINEKGITWLGWESGWGRRMTGPNSCVDFSKDEKHLSRLHSCSQKEYKFEERWPSFMFTACLQHQKAPKWAEITVDDEWNVDSDLFARYCKAFVKHIPCLVFIPSSLEGIHNFNQRFNEAIVKSARAIKEIDPRIKVGSIAHFADGVEEARKISKELLETVDFFIDDIYNTKVNALAFKKELDKRGYGDKEVWLGEHGNLSVRDQIGSASTMIDYVSYAFSHGIDKLYWWTAPAKTHFMKRDDWDYSFEELRDSYRLAADVSFSAGWRTSKRWPGKTRYWYPFLSLLAKYHLNNHLGYSYDGKQIKLDGGDTAYFFKNKLFPGKKNQTISVMTMNAPPASGHRHYLLKNTHPFQMIDVFGRQTRITPVNGCAMVTVSEYPRMVNFDGELTELQAQKAGIEFSYNPRTTAGGMVDFKVTITNRSNSPSRGSVIPYVDTRWTFTPRKAEISIPPGQVSTLRFSLQVPRTLEAGVYPVFFDFMDDSQGGDEVCRGHLTESLVVSGPVDLTVDSIPAVKPGRAKIKVTLRNNSPQQNKMTLSFVNPITKDWRPRRIKKIVTVPANSNSSIFFELDGQPKSNRAYPFDFLVESSEGEMLRTAKKLFFIPVVKATKPIVVDGNFDDWEIDQLQPLTFTFHDNGCNKKTYTPRGQDCWQGVEDASLRFYMRWDENRLYWLAIIIDDIKHNAGEFSGIWRHDCLHICLYPWKKECSDITKGVPYKDHCGLDKHHSPTIDRCQSPFQSPPGKQGWMPPNTLFNARRTKSGYILEGGYGMEAIRPLALRVGSKFRMTLTYYDHDEKIPRYFSSWFQGSANVDGSVDAFGQLTLVDAPVNSHSKENSEKETNVQIRQKR